MACTKFVNHCGKNIQNLTRAFPEVGPMPLLFYMSWGIYICPFSPWPTLHPPLLKKAFALKVNKHEVRRMELIRPKKIVVVQLK